MANKELTDLPEATSAGSLDIFHVKDSLNVDKKITLDNLSKTLTYSTQPELTVATMVANPKYTTASVGKTVVETKEFSTGNGGGGIYDIISGTGTANGYNIIAHGTNSISFVLRTNEYGSIDVRQLGANGTPSTDPAAFQHALDNFEHVTASRGTYYVKDLNWPISEGRKLIGAGQNSTEFINDSTTAQNCINLVGTGSTPNSDRVAYANLEGFTITGNASGGHGIFTDLAYENRFTAIRVRNCGGATHDGIHIKRGFYSELYRITAEANGRDGVHLGETANGNIIYGGHYGGGGALGNGRAGVFIGSDGGLDRTHGCQVFGGVFESNDQYNVLIDDASGCYINGTYQESAASAGTTALIAIQDSSGGGETKGNMICNNDFFGDVLNISLQQDDETLVAGNSIRFGFTIAATSTTTKVYFNPLFLGTFTDGGSGTIVHQDPATSDRWYEKSGSDKRFSMLFGGSLTRVNYGGAFPVDFQINGTDVIRLDNSDFSFKHFFTAWDRPLILNDTYFWMEGKNFRAKQGAAPASSVDGNIIGTAL